MSQVMIEINPAGPKERNPEALRKIWWIASFPKSGNTLVRMFINTYITKFPLDINANFQYATNDQQPQMFQQVTSKPLTECDPWELIYLRPAALLQYCHWIAPRDACMKTHHARLNVDGIPLIPSRLTKQAVYIVRDPRDVAISYAAHSGLSIDRAIDIMAKSSHVGNREGGLEDIMSSWSAHVDSWTLNQHFPTTVVHYEDMIDKKEKTFRRILPALGFKDIDEEAFALAMRETEFGNLQKQEGDKGFRERKYSDSFFRVGKYGQWKEGLTSLQMAKIYKNHGATMERMGYFWDEPISVLPQEDVLNIKCGCEDALVLTT